LMLPEKRGIPERRLHRFWCVIGTGKKQMPSRSGEARVIRVRILSRLIERSRWIGDIEIVEIFVEVIRVGFTSLVTNGRAGDALLREVKKIKLQMRLSPVLDGRLLYVLDVFGLVVAMPVDVLGERAIDEREGRRKLNRREKLDVGSVRV